MRSIETIRRGEKIRSAWPSEVYFAQLSPCVNHLVETREREGEYAPTLRSTQVLQQTRASNNDHRGIINVGDGSAWEFDPGWREEDDADWHDTFTKSEVGGSEFQNQEFQESDAKKKRSTSHRVEGQNPEGKLNMKIGDDNSPCDAGVMSTGNQNFGDQKFQEARVMSSEEGEGGTKSASHHFEHQNQGAKVDVKVDGEKSQCVAGVPIARIQKSTNEGEASKHQIVAHVQPARWSKGENVNEDVSMTTISLRRIRGEEEILWHKSGPGPGIRIGDQAEASGRSQGGQEHHRESVRSNSKQGEFQENIREDI